jgi:hypothetical protein
MHSITLPSSSLFKVIPAEFLLSQSWFDPRLIHNDNQRTNRYLNGVHHVGELWIPEIYSAGAETTSTTSSLALYIYGNGSVLYTMRWARPFSTALQCF